MATLANSEDPDEMRTLANSEDPEEMRTLANSEDPDEIPQYAAFRQSVLFVKVKPIWKF